MRQKKLQMAHENDQGWKIPQQSGQPYFSSIALSGPGALAQVEQALCRPMLSPIQNQDMEQKGGHPVSAYFKHRDGFALCLETSRTETSPTNISLGYTWQVCGTQLIFLIERQQTHANQL